MSASGSLSVGGGGLAPLRIGRSNTLHLSVGAPSDEDDDDDEMDEGESSPPSPLPFSLSSSLSASSLRASVSAWHRASAASHKKEEEPFIDISVRSPLGVLPGIGGRRGDSPARDEVTI